MWLGGNSCRPRPVPFEHELRKLITVRSLDPEQLHLAPDALETTCARRRPVEARRVADGVTRGLGDHDSSRTCRAGDTACYVDWTAEPVARMGYRAPEGNA